MEELIGNTQRSPFLTLFAERQLTRGNEPGSGWTKWCTKQTRKDGTEEADVDHNDPANETDPNSLGGW